MVMTKIVASRHTHVKVAPVGLQRRSSVCWGGVWMFGDCSNPHFQLRWTLLRDDMMAELRTFLGWTNFHTDFSFLHTHTLSRSFALSTGVFSSTKLFPYSMLHLTTVIFLAILRNSAFVPSEEPATPVEIIKPKNHSTFFTFSAARVAIPKSPNSLPENPTEQKKNSRTPTRSHTNHTKPSG